jgi:hypothetical protein
MENDITAEAETMQPKQPAALTWNDCKWLKSMHIVPDVDCNPDWTAARRLTDAR